MKEPKVSVVLAVYNAEQHLEQCLESLQRQTLKEIEIICVDDGSLDRSNEILCRYEQNDPRFRVICQKNAGAGAARNTGLQYIRGKYSIFLDADDFFETDMLESALDEAERQQADVIVFGCDIFQNNQYLPCTYSIRRELLPKKECFALTDVQRDAFKLFTGWAWDKLFRTDLIRENALRFQEQRTTNDMLFVFSALLKAKRIAIKDRVLAHYRREAGTLSVTREKSWHCFYDALLALRTNLQSWGMYSRFERDFLNYCVHFSLWNLNTLCEPTYTLLYDKLREEWYRELGVLERPASYFYDKAEYREFKNVMNHSAGWRNSTGGHLQITLSKCIQRLRRIIGILKNGNIDYALKYMGDKFLSKSKPRNKAGCK